MISTEVERAKSYWHFDLPGEMSIPVARPRLPTTDEIAPYLRRIDASRWYSNGGPLVQEFEERLAQHFSDGSARVATVATGPGQNLAKQMESKVDVALVFSNPASASVEWSVAYGQFFTQISRLVAEQLALSVLDQTRSRKLFEIPTPVYGGVSGYLNLSRRGDAASHSEND